MQKSEPTFQSVKSLLLKGQLVNANIKFTNEIKKKIVRSTNKFPKLYSLSKRHIREVLLHK